MNISSTSSFSAAQSVRGQQRPNQQEVLASALKSVGVDDETAADVLSQVKEAVDSLQSDSSANSSDRSAVHSAIAGVLEANGIDPSEVGDTIQASRSTSGPQQSGGPRGGGRPSGPPPPRSAQGSGDEIGSIESALLSADVEEANVNKLLTQMIETISNLTAKGASETSSDSIRAALTKVLEENGVDVEQFEQALPDKLGSNESFFNRVA
jgi:division protein CdvB (Snf7/Vps24/ESCRT-III family)